MPTVTMMEEEDLEKLEESGGLKVATLAARRREMEFFMTYWKEEGKQDLEEVFKTPEGCTKFSKLLGRFDSGVFCCPNNCPVSFQILLPVPCGQGWWRDCAQAPDC